MLERTDLESLPFLGERRTGKVRDVYPVLPRAGAKAGSATAGNDAGSPPADHRLVLVTTDRLSAFDRVLGLVDGKGQVLNQLSAWWFEELADVVDHHLVAVPDPNVAVVRACRPLPVEVVVRGYITGVTSTSLWRQYEEGGRELYGLRLPEGLAKNDRLPLPVVTPTTKAQDGAHDEPITPAELVARGLVDADLWGRLATVALQLFERGQARAAGAGLVLVDTKYEFGLDAADRLVLIDEVHTPDSSRYWEAATLERRRADGQEPDSADKELVRRWYVDRGYRGEGEPEPLPAELAAQVAARYVAVYERLTGRAFRPAPEPAPPRIEAALRRWHGEGP